MGWKLRNGRRYFYRSVRRDGRVVTEYVGTGEVAALIAKIDGVKRDLKKLDALDWRDERDRLVAIDRRQAGRFNLVEALVRLTLESAGFHRHQRGEWRRRRMSSDQARIEAEPPSSKRPTPAERRKILKRARQGDHTVLPQLREIFLADPEGMVETCQGNLAHVAEAVIVTRIADQDLAFTEAIRMKLSILRAELGGPNPSPVERLLAEDVVLCWLECHDWEIRYNNTEKTNSGLSLKQHMFFQTMRDRSHRRYLQAMKMLTTVRKMGPAIQINLAHQQVNVSG